MSEKSKKIIYLAYGILQSLLLLLCGGCLVYACLTIHDGGNGTFSREAVSVQFDKIALPVMICLAGVVVGMILSLTLPREARKLKGRMTPADAIKHLSSRVDGATCPAELTSARIKEQNLRLILRILAAAICVIVAIPCVLYLFDLSNFDDIGAGLTEDIVAAMKVVLPAAAVGLSAWIVVTFACHLSLKRELDILKEALKAAPVQEKAVAQANASKGHAAWVIRGVILVVALAFIVLGIINGSMEDVLQKAIRICTECIGLG